MNPVKQNIFGNGADGTVPGNCLQAAVATIFEIGLDSVPHFVQFHGDWWDMFVSWLDDHYGMYPFSFDYNKGIHAEVKGYYLVTGMSKRGYPHTVVYQDGVMIHDPHPDNSGIISPESICVFVQRLDRCFQIGR